MRKIIAVFFLCLSACQSSTSQAQSASFGLSESVKEVDPSLVTLSSEYKDESDPNHKVKIHGSGFLVQSGSRLFVITAAHLSQGENLELSAKDQKLKIIARLYNGLSDVEVIEVEPGLKTNLQTEGSYIVWKSETLPRVKWVDRLNFVPLNSWVHDPNIDLDNRFQKTRESEIYCDLHCFMLHAETLMQPGSSGSPLIARVPNSKEWSSNLLPYDLREGKVELLPESFMLRGLVIRRERFFSRSAFVTFRQIAELLASYIKGERTDEKKIESRWYLNGGLLVRGSDSFIESGAVAGSSGNGVSMDGGDLEKINEEQPKALFDQVKAFPVNQHPGEGPRETTLWMIAMRHPTTSALISFPAWFDIEENVRLSRFLWGLRPEDPTNVLSHFFMRFGSKGMPTSLSAIKGQGQILKGQNEITVVLNLSQGDQLKFRVNREGFICQTSCTGRFDPITEAKSDRGEAYLVDLRALLSVDHSLSRTDLYRDPKLLELPKEATSKLFYDEMIRDANVIRLSVRKKRTGSNAPMTVEQGLPIQFQWKIE